jgi:hypothetical protein
MALTLEGDSRLIVCCSRHTTAGVFVAMGLLKKIPLTRIKALAEFLKHLACADSFFLQPLNLSKLFCDRFTSVLLQHRILAEQRSTSFSSRFKIISLLPIYLEVSVEARGIHSYPIIAIHQALLVLCIAVIFLVLIKIKYCCGSLTKDRERKRAF